MAPVQGSSMQRVPGSLALQTTWFGIETVVIFAAPARFLAAAIAAAAAAFAALFAAAARFLAAFAAAARFF